MDRFARWARFGTTPDDRGRRRFLIIQIDGLSREILDRALATGRVPHMARLLRTRLLARRDLSVGIPSSTPAFQGAIMYGVKPDIPGFHYYDRRAGVELHFPKPGVADLVEQREFDGRQGILEDGSCYGCVFTGGAPDSLLTFSRLMKPTRARLPLLRLLFSFGTLAWVVVKCLGLTVVELGRFIARLATDRAARREGLKWLGLKIGFSVWIRQLFTLAVSADLYRGVPAIYVNYLDYDVFAHAYGPGHRTALRALTHVDHSIGQLARITARLPELGYDLYVLSDHGQAATRTFTAVSAGRTIGEVVLTTLAESKGAGRAAPTASRRAPGRLEPAKTRRGGGIQRMLNHGGKLHDGRVSWSGEVPDPVHVIAAGPNSFVYFTDSPDPLTADEIHARFPGVAERLSESPGVGIVLARAANGFVCWWRGRRLSWRGDGFGPFADRADRQVIVEGLRDLMAMPSAGDFVLYGISAPEGDVSFIPERGAHAGASQAEMQTFILHPSNVELPEEPLTHPIQLYPHFLAYRNDVASQAAGPGLKDAGTLLA